MLDPRLRELDDLLDASNEALLSTSALRRREWGHRVQQAWLFHELQLEGVALVPDDIARSLGGEDGADWCDRMLLEQIRRGAELLSTVRHQGLEESELTVPLLECWHMAFCGTDCPPGYRTTEGATENYKHEVVAAAQIATALEEALARAMASRDDGHPVEVASRLLFELMRVWPWGTWSALLARLSASVVLVAGGYPPLIIPAGERSNYYQAMHYDAKRMDALVYRCLREQLMGALKFAKSE